MKKNIFLLITVFTTFIFVSCGNKNNEGSVPSPEEMQIIEEIEVPEPIIYHSQYTNKIIDNPINPNTSFMTVVENSKEARPQSGISSASIVFETLAEGGIPRFILLFEETANVSEIGPVRSFRRIFADIAKMTDLPFAHCGASEEGKNIIFNDNLKSLDEFYNGKFYYRSSDRYAPHNLYTSQNSIELAIKEKNFSYSDNLKLNFDDNFWMSDSLLPCNSAMINFSNYYNTEYIYDGTKYVKYMDGVISTDKNTSSPLTFDNIFIQKTFTQINPNGVHLDIQFYGNGTGILISKGKYIDVNWSTDVNGITLTDLNGNLVPFSTGNTIWNIPDTNSTIDIK